MRGIVGSPFQLRQGQLPGRSRSQFEVALVVVRGHSHGRISEWNCLQKTDELLNWRGKIPFCRVHDKKKFFEEKGATLTRRAGAETKRGKKPRGSQARGER